MARSSSPERTGSVLATLVGWLVVAVVGWVLLTSVLGVIRWLVRGVILVAVILGLLWAYAALKAPKDPPA